MRILVVSATEQEISPSLTFLEEHKVEVLITGVGMLATCYALTKKLQQGSYDLVLNVGIGGVLDRTTVLGQVYRVIRDSIYRFGAEDKDEFISIENLGFGTSSFVECLASSIDESKIGVPTVDGITVHTVHGCHESIDRLRRFHSGNIMESMEGAAVFYVANQEQVPVLQFRAASNYIEPRNRSAWQIGSAIANLNGFLKKLIVKFK